MILRVNLLPYREARRLRMLQTIIAAWVATAVVGLGIIFFTKAMILDHIEAQQAVQAKNKAIIAALDEKLGEIKDINKRKKEVKTRLGIIETLSRQRDLPVHLLEGISTAIPEKVWLKEILTLDNKLSIIGFTLSNAMVADFMRQLDASDFIDNINLNNITQLNSRGNENRKLREFNLSATIVIPAPPDKEEPTSTKNGGGK